MPQALTTQQISQYITQIQNGGVEQARQVYDTLNAQGYNYAGWAAGVARGDSITGASALNFMQGTALMGMGGDACRNLTQVQTDKIRVDMATGYLETLKGIAEESGNIVTRDVNYKETEQFHKDAFVANNLTLDNWTLKTPIDLIRQNQGDAAVEKLWDCLRDTGGTGLDALLGSASLLFYTWWKLETSSDPEDIKKAQQWMDNAPGLAGWDQITRSTDVLNEYLNFVVPEVDKIALGFLLNLSKSLSSSISAVSTILGIDPLVKTIHYVDPLILDLDGDGLEITQLSQGILFDANGDTIKTGTAWAGADDGMLVRDLNGNGLIDTGAELFGDETLLANGQKAANGFAALAQLDANADGKFNANDAKYTSLRVWRDLNQDGISQAGELQTLAASGVKSIALASSNASASYGDAILAQSGTYTRADGSVGQAGSFILAQNSFVREFTPITVSEAAKALPSIAGAGWVRDLQEAATQSPELIALINQAKGASTRAGYKDAVATLMREWGNDSAYVSASKQALAAGYGLILSDPANAQEAGWINTAIKASEADRNAYRATLSESDLGKFDAMRERMVGGLENLHAYEAFTGHSFLNWAQVQGDAFNYTSKNRRMGCKRCSRFAGRLGSFTEKSSRSRALKSWVFHFGFESAHSSMRTTLRPALIFS